MKKTAIDIILSELELIRDTTIDAKKRDGIIIAIGIVKSKYSIELEQIKNAYDYSWFVQTADEYYNATYRKVDSLTQNDTVQ